MGEIGELEPPEPLADHHDIEDFRSGEASPDDWLMRRARSNQVSGASRTYSTGIRGIVVQAISEEAKTFYLALGFDASPSEPMTLMVTLSDIRAVLSQKPARK